MLGVDNRLLLTCFHYTGGSGGILRGAIPLELCDCEYR